MNNTNYINVSNQVTRVRALEVISNNLANMNTQAFKGERLNFKEFVERLEPKDGDLSFVQTRSISRDPSVGAIKTTNNPYDLALSKEGYFHISTPKGERFTRAGSFTLNEENRLTTLHGFYVLDQNQQPITLPDDFTEVKINGDGSLVVDGVETGQSVAVVNFDNDEALTKVGNNLYIPLLGEDYQVTDGGIIQNANETSNVNPIIEITHMIDASRTFEAIQKFIDDEEQRQGKIINYMSSNA